MIKTSINRTKVKVAFNYGVEAYNVTGNAVNNSIDDPVDGNWGIVFTSVQDRQS
ncbi:MAG TPA: hypothetical protein VMA09_23265 [Candidatus Binataceae bacterium]|nr:hypothetical protein [Candidatus Binataceae bacterium]